MQSKRGMVFGVFDGLHEGHRYFLRVAAARSEELVVVVAQDDAVLLLKGRLPKRTLQERMRAIADIDASWKVIPGDSAPGTWKVLEAHTPDVIFLGHDQEAVAHELAKRNVRFSYLDAHQPERYKSSIIDETIGA